MEVVDFDLDSIPISGESASSNFGTGIELLMNEKKKASSGSTKIDLEELDSLETELNDLSSQPMSVGGGGSGSSATTGEDKHPNGLSGFSNMFNFGPPKEAPTTEAPAQSSMFFSSDSNVGAATKENTSANQSSTWDGFTKMGAEIPKSASSSSANMLKIRDTMP